MITANREGADVQGLCHLAGIARASYYRGLGDHALREADIDLFGQIQTISLRHRFYGYWRITAQLRRQGVIANAKWVQRLMREDNLTAMRRKPFIPPSPDSRPF